MSSVVLVLAAAGILAGCRGRPGRGRAAGPTRFPGWREGPAARRGSAAALGLAMAWLLGGVPGLVIGTVAALGAAHGLRRLEPARARRRRESREAELPLVLDLLAVCLHAGMPLVAAMETVADALPGPFDSDLRVVAGLQRLGAGASTAWAEFADDPDLAPVARAVRRSAESGSRLAAAFERLAVDRRSALVSTGLARARTAGVIAMAPLGLCFLPAFVCIGIAPIALSLATQVLP